METTIKTYRKELLTLFVATIIGIMSYQSVSHTYYMPTSKIEEGTIVLRDDSITTIVIPDRR